jgi:TetR/AcrR family transcriptional regulator
MDSEGDPLEEILGYVRRKMEMTRAFPRESRLFANEILQGAPRMGPDLESGLKPLFDRKTAVIRSWMAQGKLAQVDPRHLIFSIWATTQHYADFDAQVQVLVPADENVLDGAESYIETLFTKLLTP